MRASPPDNKMIYPSVHPFPSPPVLAVPAFLNNSQETLSRGAFPPYAMKRRNRSLFSSSIFNKMLKWMQLTTGFISCFLFPDSSQFTKIPISIIADFQ